MTELFTNGTFYSPTSGPLLLPQVLEAIRLYIEEKPERSYEIIVGCDSSATEDPSFPVAIVLLRKGMGGRFFLKRIAYPRRKFYSLQERILNEVVLSCELALWLREELKKTLDGATYTFEYIHADVGQHGPTKEMIKDVTGMIRGNGFEPVIKPFSFAASSVADRFS